jgi:hypothetical protein
MSKIFHRFWLDKTLVMFGSMICASQKYKIFKSVITRYSVDMMNYFIAFYLAFQMSGHNKNASTNISTLGRIGMIWKKDKDTSFFVGSDSTLPIGISYTMPRSFRSTHEGSIIIERPIVKSLP